MRKSISLILLITFFTHFDFQLNAQSADTVKVMVYNLLNYRNNSISGCSNNNNNPTTKENDLETIIDYALPDVLLCNEIGTSDPAASFRLSQNALNQNGRNYYSFTTMQTGNRQNINGSSTGNMIFWDNRKLELYNSQFLEFDPFNRALVRVVDLYTLYYKDPNLAVHGDTVFLNIFIAHFKAGQTNADTAERNWAANAIMHYLNTNNLDGNYLVAGDLNLYRSTEPAFQNLTNHPNQAIRFVDPALPNGNWTWTNNSPFSSIHTQSTRTSGGCGAGGGMDDRFDFILASDEIMNGTDSLEYIPNSYQTLGQDGLRFNGSLTGSPTNTSAPAGVIQALEDLSDHLPILMDIEIKLPGITSLNEPSRELKVSFNNPVEEVLYLNNLNNIELESIEILDMSGRVVGSFRTVKKGRVEVNCSHLKGGIYFLRVVDSQNNYSIQKLIKI